MFKIYNTLTKRKENFELKKKIFIYVCGVTVYDNCHIGHSRSFLFFDSLIRYLNFLNIKVILIRNITDIDDKILERAKNENKSFKQISKKFIQNMHYDIKKLSLFEPSFEPKATEFITDMLNLVNFLYDNSYVYLSKNNDFYYNLKSFSDYGILSYKKIDNTSLIDENKLNIEDFVVWKNEIFFKKWKSFVGYGRPGWHTECAAMSLYYSKNFIDIHSGGIDLLFPHHENERIQTKSFLKYDVVKFWVHTGQLMVDEKKMSKSLNNYLLIRDFLKKYNEEYLRFFFLLTHYRKPINYSYSLFIKSVKILDNFYKMFYFLNLKKYNIDCFFKDKFLKSLNNDFNTPNSISILFEILNTVKNTKDFNTIFSQNLIYTIKFLGNLIGIFKYEPDYFFKSNFISNKILKLIEKRKLARLNSNWKLADNIRNKLFKLGIKLNDGTNYTFFEKL